MRIYPQNNLIFLEDAISDKIRLDGRNLLDMRDVKLEFFEIGNVECLLGSTRVCAKVSCEPAVPYADKPSEGFLSFSCEISPISSPEFEAGKISEQEIMISRMIEKVLRGSRAVDIESLCIISGKLVWSIRVDVHILDHDGNLLDCAVIAASTALLHYRRPDVTVSGEDVSFHSMEERQPVPLSIHHVPLCISFSFFGEGEHIVVDPSYNEELIQKACVVTAVNAQREICCLSKVGGLELDQQKIFDCLSIAFAKYDQVYEVIDRKVKEDLKARDIQRSSLKGFK